ncbi:MAG: hypothetical protein AB8H86_13750 [Polyangiales bacterium]
MVRAAGVSGDHLDVVGHFNGEANSAHTDWLTSGAGFREAKFQAAMSAIAGHLLADEEDARSTAVES